MSNKRKLIPLGLVLIGFLVLISLYLVFFESIRPGPTLDVKPAVGVVAPDFELSSLGGDHVKLSNLRGKVVFLNIWATWCPPCREEIPSMKSLYQRLEDRPFEMLAVSIDREGEKIVRPFAEKHGLTFRVLLDPDGKTYQLYGMTGVPETFIIDNNGVITQKIIGPQNWMKQEWLDYFNRIIG